MSQVALPLLTASRLQAYRRCPREERLRYQLGLKPQATEAMRFGTLVHLGLEAWWKADPAERLAAALSRVAGEAIDGYEQARVDCLLTGYDARWGAERFTVIAVEQEFRVPLMNPDSSTASRTWELGGKLDALAVNDRGQTVVIEHKTSSSEIGPGSDYISRLKLDGQVSMYLRAARDLVPGGADGGVLYDVIGKVALRPYKKSAEIKLKKDGTPYANCRIEDETPDEYRARVVEHIAANPDDYYQRAQVVRLEDELREFERELWQQGGQLRDGVRLGIAPRNPDACRRFNSMCSFWPLCSGEANESAYERGPIHPELGPKEEVANG